MDSDSGTDLPASLATAWGLRERPGKGPKPGLSLDRIVAAALRVAEADGFAAVSMNRIAKELGVSAMALYRYVAAKDELIPLMLDAAIGGPPEPRADGEGWREAMARWCWTYREALGRNPWALRVTITEPPNTPQQIAWFEHGLASLRGTGLTTNEKISVVMLLSGYVRNTEAMFHGIAEAVAAALSTEDQMMSSYSDVLRKVIDPERFPCIASALDEGVFDQADSAEGEFAFGLERVLDGIDVLVSSRS
ncbi:TetR/AcrR family transcriptional regulator [Actinomadura sp. DC4]|uniref:TetR/AcrR family transcriptional regulator n=1 Tax=Actinomadura sp. DC4 TaxID=3055069 RepID=UPI0025B1D11D|nr:TetR/AcrR family transcriptional regulator [Actinomadura sp. DC4]MDN3352943.1 TetR/AcrR family transcriptional regulator [Actinomadura sp. DC4]